MRSNLAATKGPTECLEAGNLHANSNLTGPAENKGLASSEELPSWRNNVIADSATYTLCAIMATAAPIRCYLLEQVQK